MVTVDCQQCAQFSVQSILLALTVFYFLIFYLQIFSQGAKFSWWKNFRSLCCNVELILFVFFFIFLSLETSLIVVVIPRATSSFHHENKIGCKPIRALDKQSSKSNIDFISQLYKFLGNFKRALRGLKEINLFKSSFNSSFMRRN